MKSYVREISPEENIPRPKPAINLENFTPVHAKGGAVVGDDPFHSITHGVAPTPTPEPEPAQTPKGDIVRRPQPVKPLDKQEEEPTTGIQLDAPEAIKF